MRELGQEFIFLLYRYESMYRKVKSYSQQVVELEHEPRSSGFRSCVISSSFRLCVLRYMSGGQRVNVGIGRVWGQLFWVPSLFLEIAAHCTVGRDLGEVSQGLCIGH